MKAFATKDAADRHVNVVQQLEEATRRQTQLAASLPEVTKQATEAARARAGAEETLETHEGDTLVGAMSAERIARTRARYDAAVTEDRLASAKLRQVQLDLERIDAAIARLAPDVNALKIARYTSRQAALVKEARERLVAVARVNQSLHELYVAASCEFPDTARRSGVDRGYPVAAGLSDLSFPWLNESPYAANGGPFRTWLLRVEAFLAEQEGA